MAIKINNTTVIDNSRNFVNYNGIEVSGIVTASPGAAITYYGDGSNLTGVSGSVSFDDINAGIITASAYDGFIVSGTKVITDNSTFSNDNSNLSFAETIEVSPGVTFTVSAGTTVTVDPFKDIIPETLELPSGTTEERQGTPSTGALRYNTDLNAIEVYIGSEWRKVKSSVITSGRAISGITDKISPSSPVSSTYDTPTDSFNINTGGTNKYFGTLIDTTQSYSCCSSSTRAVFGGGINGPSAIHPRISYVTITSESDALDFGNLVYARGELNSCSNSTRGIFSGGSGPSISTDTSEMDFITIASLGDGQFFGDAVITPSTTGCAACASPTRGIFAGNNQVPLANGRTINYITFSSVGDGVDFGDLTDEKEQFNGCSNSIRGVFGGGETPTVTNVMEYITIATTGNGIDFGDLVEARSNAGSTSNSTRGVFMGGHIGVGVESLIVDFIEIATTGNAIDYGSLGWGDRQDRTSTSNSHGGLS